MRTGTRVRALLHLAIALSLAGCSTGNQGGFGGRGEIHASAGRTSARAPAPGTPGRLPQPWAPANKDGFGTSKSIESKLWYTLQGGALTEVYYPDLGTPSVRDLQLIVSDGSSFAERESEATVQVTELADRRALIYRQVNTARSGRYRITKEYFTDPDRSTLVIDVVLESLDGGAYQVYVLYHPRLGNPGKDEGRDTGHTRDGFSLLASGPGTSSALLASPPFARTSSGYAGKSDGWEDLRTDFRMDWQYYAPKGGNVVQTAKLALRSSAGRQHVTLYLGFGPNESAALLAGNGSVASGADAVRERFAGGWRSYVDRLRTPPAVLDNDRLRLVYDTAVMILAAHEDKTYRGAFVASPSMPWAWGSSVELENPSGAYHVVWARDVAGKAAGLRLAGDEDAATRALQYLFERQQIDRPGDPLDGSFPQNSLIDGTPHWRNTQMDETAFPIVLAWTLGKTDAATWARVKRAADFLVRSGPYTVQERWENQGGYSPATIAAEIAGLVCAAEIARANGDMGAAEAYLAKADAWQASVKRWTVTRTGKYTRESPGPQVPPVASYFVRLTKEQRPDEGTEYRMGDSGPERIDQRDVVDPSFLELVRLGVLPWDDPDVLNTIRVVDAQLSEITPTGQHWHRYTFDGYGEVARSIGEAEPGDEWSFSYPAGTLATRGRLWPLFAGERGEYELISGDRKLAYTRLVAMAQAGHDSGILGEQVWDHHPPGGQPKFPIGKPTFSASPLGWAHGQFIRLAWSIEEEKILSWPCVVARRYLPAERLGTTCPPSSQRHARPSAGGRDVSPR